MLDSLSELKALVAVRHLAEAVGAQVEALDREGGRGGVQCLVGRGRGRGRLGSGSRRGTRRGRGDGVCGGWVRWGDERWG
jgi:hypothetical protein